MCRRLPHTAPWPPSPPLLQPPIAPPLQLPGSSAKRQGRTSGLSFKLSHVRIPPATSPAGTPTHTYRARRQLCLPRRLGDSRHLFAFGGSAPPCSTLVGAPQPFPYTSRVQISLECPCLGGSRHLPEGARESYSEHRLDAGYTVRLIAKWELEVGACQDSGVSMENLACPLQGVQLKWRKWFEHGLLEE